MEEAKDPMKGEGTGPIKEEEKEGASANALKDIGLDSEEIKVEKEGDLGFLPKVLRRPSKN